MSSSEWPIRKALTQPILVMGTEKILLLTNVMICLVWALASRLTLMGWLAIPLFIGLHSICVMVSTSDPRTVEVYKRSNRYRQGYYPPIGGLESIDRHDRPFRSMPYRTGSKR